jgi:hypothetical protein
VYKRGCARSYDFNDEEDKCQSYKFFQTKRTTCVCDEDIDDDDDEPCNSTMNIASSSLFITFMITFTLALI